jgi:hypothetical protein
MTFEKESVTSITTQILTAPVKAAKGAAHTAMIGAVAA